MSAESLAAPAGAVTRDRAPARDPFAAHVITGLTVATLATLLSLQRHVVTEAVANEWVALVSWAFVIGVVNLLPLQVEDFSLTLDLPLLLAIAISMSPEAAAAVAFVSTLDTREVGTSRVGVSRALFNRSQVALCVLVAGWAYHAVATDENMLALAAAGTAVALMVDYLLNTGLVVLHIAARKQMALFAVATKLTVGESRYFLATYLGFGVMALVVARLSQGVGFWSVLAFLVPVLIARQALLGDLHLQHANDRVALQNRLLERALDRVVEEREDERLRVAEELHDEVLQCLYSLRMTVACTQKSESRGGEDPELLVRVDGAIATLREVVRGLRRSPLGAAGFLPTLQALIRELGSDWPSRITLESSGPVILPSRDQVLLYQVIREALLNALKHSESRDVIVRLTSNSRRTLAIVEDHGVGFSVDKSERPSHFGLELIRRRADRLGARLQIDSRPGKGTRLSIAIPANRDH